MRSIRQWAAAALSAVLAASILTLPALAAPEDAFAEFRIDAANMDAPERTVAVTRYEIDGAGALRAAGTSEYECRLNRVTEDASFYIQPDAEGVSVAVDYLADLDGDGAYELIDSDASPMRDGLDQRSILSFVTDSPVAPLTGGETYIVSAESLSSRFRQAVRRGARALGLEQAAGQSFPLCRVTLRQTGSDRQQTYYLELYGKVLTPSDLSPGQWYYNAVEYCLAQGYFTGAEDGRFYPDEPLNRAQLAQVLWTVGGCLESDSARFTDAGADDWFYQAISWCQQEELIAGYEDGSFAPDVTLTREQLASVLYRYARRSGSSLRATADLSQYADSGDISPWAYDSMRWAMSNRLFTTEDNALRPTAAVSRGELAAALYTYDINLGVRGSTW